MLDRAFDHGGNAGALRAGENVKSVDERPLRPVESGFGIGRALKSAEFAYVIGASEDVDPLRTMI